MTFFLVQVWLWKVLCSVFLGSATELVLTDCSIESTFYCMSQIQLRNDLLLHRIRENDTSKWWFFWFADSPRGTHLPSFFTFPVCFKCETNHRMVDTEFLGNFSCSCKRISFEDGSQLLLSTSDGWPLCSSSSRLLSPLQTLNWPLYWMFVSSSWARCIVDVASCLHCLMTHFELK